ncbi:MAG: glycosyltransferase, partial [Bacteroidetes bacterium]|nr:glycosyltransferase [Bacteroidota bacterium]
RNKNIIAGIEAIGQLRKKYEKVEYHIIGGGEDEALIRQKAGELDPGGEWIFFYGRRENTFVLDFMRTIDFILTNSRIETFSVATAEALAMGKPVVATRSGGPEFFVNEHNGILINPGDQKELSAALEKMTLTFNTYDPKAISAEVLEKYGGKSVGLEFYNLYKEILPINHV